MGLEGVAAAVDPAAYQVLTGLADDATVVAPVAVEFLEV